MIKIRTTLCSGILAVVLAIAVFLLIPSQIEITAKAAAQTINQRTMPYLSAGLILAMGVVMIVQSLAFKKEKVITITIKDELRTLLFYAGILIAILLMPYITFLGTAAVVYVFSFFFMKRNSIKNYLVSAAFALVIYFVFKMFLNVPLP